MDFCFWNKNMRYRDETLGRCDRGDHRARHATQWRGKWRGVGRGRCRRLHRCVLWRSSQDV